MSISHRNEAVGIEKIEMFQLLYCTEVGKEIHFWAEGC